MKYIKRIITLPFILLIILIAFPLSWIFNEHLKFSKLESVLDKLETFADVE